jgi:hypothetical protein
MAIVLDSLILSLVAGGVAAGAASTVGWGLYSWLSVRVPPDRALVLYGRGSARSPAESPRTPGSAEIGRPRIVVDGRVFLAPWDRGVGYLSLHPVTVDVSVRSLHSLEASRASGWEVRVSVQAKIPADSDLLFTAAENLLGKSEEEVRGLVRHAVEGVIPAVLSRLRPEETGPDWERLASEIQATAAPDLLSLGLVIRTLSVTEVIRIVPDEGSTLTAAKSASLRSGATASAAFGQVLPPLEGRLTRLERNLGILGAEVVHLLHESVPVHENHDAGLEPPLTLEASTAAALGPPEDASDHSSMGGDRSPRSRPPSRDGATGEGGVRRRPPSDDETKR